VANEERSCAAFLASADVFQQLFDAAKRNECGFVVGLAEKQVQQQLQFLLVRTGDRTPDGG